MSRPLGLSVRLLKVRLLGSDCAIDMKPMSSWPRSSLADVVPVTYRLVSSEMHAGVAEQPGPPCLVQFCQYNGYPFSPMPSSKLGLRMMFVLKGPLLSKLPSIV